MGSYTSIALFCALGEDRVGEEDIDERPSNFDLINGFMKNFCGETIEVIDIHGHWYIGNIFIRNTFWLDDLKNFILKLYWNYPEDFHLIWHEENGKKTVYNLTDKTELQTMR